MSYYQSKDQYYSSTGTDAFSRKSSCTPVNQREGSFSEQYNSRKSNHKDLKSATLDTILGMYEYSGFSSHLMLRIVDY